MYYAKSLFRNWARSKEPPEPPLKEGLTRIRWTCECGKALWDDFRELRPGAAEKLRKELDVYERRGVQSPRILSNNGHTLAPVTVPGNRTDSETTTAPSGATRSNGGISSPGGASGAATNKKPEAPQNWNLPHDAPPVDKKFLLVCMSKPGDTMRLSQFEISGIKGDFELGRMLKRAFATNQGNYAGLLRFLSPIKIDAILPRKIQCYSPPYPKGLADIYDVGEKRPHRTNLDIVCHKNHQLCDTTYETDPPSPDLLPWIGCHAFQHLVTDPHSIEDAGNNVPPQNAWLKRLPKKVKTELTPCPLYGRGIGWGIWIKDVADVNWLMWTTVRVLVLAALTFGIVWGILKKDIQGAVAVAALFISFASLVHNSVGSYVALRAQDKVREDSALRPDHGF